MATTEIDNREQQANNSFSDINWRSLTTPRARLAYSLLAYIPTENTRASDHIYSSRERLQTILTLAKALPDWGDLWDKLDPKVFSGRIGNALHGLNDGIERDDLLGASIFVLASEETCYLALDAITGNDLTNRWKEESAKEHLNDWLRKNKQEGLRIHPTSATGKDERIRAVKFPDAETYTDGLILLDKTQRGDILHTSLPGDNTVHVPRWFYLRWNRSLHAQHVPHSEFNPNYQVVIFPKPNPVIPEISEVSDQGETASLRSSDIRILHGDLPFGFELVREGKRDLLATPELVTEAYSSVFSMISNAYGIDFASRAVKILTDGVMQDDLLRRRLGNPLSILSVHMIDLPTIPAKESDLIPEITINVPDSLQLYENVKKMDLNDPGSIFGTILGFNTFNDRVLKTEQTHLSGFKDIRDDDKPAYSIHTHIELSTARTASPDHGYYDGHKIGVIQDLLHRSGYSSKYTTFHGLNSLEIVINDIEIHVNFGYASREAELAEVKTSLDDELKNGSGDTLPSYLRYDLEEVKRGKRNDSIYINMWSSDRSEQGREEYHELGNAESFIDEVGAYALAMQKIIGSLYAVEGAIPGKTDISWKPFFAPQ